MPKHYSTHQHFVWLPYHFAVGTAYKRWFDGLKDGKILGNRCPKCSKTMVPPRSFCPECNVDITEWVEVSQEGTIVTWTGVNKSFSSAPSDSPYICALVRLDGTDCNFLHLVAGDPTGASSGSPGKIMRGGRVRAVWNEDRKGHLLDIKYFQPVD
jgi:uncharacterized OB-fold protein